MYFLLLPALFLNNSVKWKPWNVLHFVLFICFLLHYPIWGGLPILLFPSFICLYDRNGSFATISSLIFLKFYSDLDKWIQLPFSPSTFGILCLYSVSEPPLTLCWIEKGICSDWWADLKLFPIILHEASKYWMLFLNSAYSFKTDEMIYIASSLYRGIYWEITSTQTSFSVFKEALAIQITPINHF